MILPELNPTNKKNYPGVMNDIGDPSEMSPIEDITGARTETPFVEITKREAWETEDPLAESEMRLPSNE
jgi:hypothetical protein